jgi:multidrug efflux pump subunit AcrA (membrane-fusion protein)
VATRTDGTQNVSSQYSTDQRNLKDAQALRTSLLKQLQAAESETAIDSIEAQLKSANAQISSAQSTLNSLNHRISYSSVTVELNSNGLPIIVNRTPRASTGFTITRAGHDALRVLVVSVGVALITLAVLVPIGLLLGLLIWIGLALRQRRREHALDTP